MQHFKFYLWLGVLSLTIFFVTGCIAQKENNDASQTDLSPSSATESSETQDTVTQTQTQQNTTTLANRALPEDMTLLTAKVMNSKGSYVAAQCYTKTKGQNNRVHNPCFSCHNSPKEPNFIDDAEFQLAYDFRSPSRINPWKNLFKDRTEAIAEISDAQITSYIRQSNYFDSQGHIVLANKMSHVPNEWDFNRDGIWNGYTPDCYFNFDSQGYDQTPQGQDTGWRAFGYDLFLGAFWPTNGNTDDVLIRLSEPFRQTQLGEYSREVYQLNLAIVEALIKKQNTVIPATNERLYGVDLNRNGELDIATQVVYKWAPNDGVYMSYVGKAKQLYDAGELKLAAGLYPVGTEFIHSVRYIDFNEQNEVVLANRFKELRYGIKINWNNYTQLRNAALDEVKEGHAFPDRLRFIQGNSEAGMLNGQGWAYQGFIEDKNGDLRPQSYEESLNCIGCHSGLGTTTDSSFAFPRKFDHSAFQGSWYHWSQKSLKDTAEPQWKDGTWEYSQYLLENQSGNEFRDNDEVFAKFFNKDGSIKQAEFDALHQDVTHLIWPSQSRAMQLNKAYKVIVDEQSYIYGRDVHVKPLNDVVWEEVPENEMTGVTELVLKP